VHPNPTEDPWALRSPDPSTLIALWPGDEAPTMPEVLNALRAGLGEQPKIVGDATTDDQSVLWNTVVELPRRSGPVIFWSEPARELDPGELDDPVALGCRWIIGAETLLDEQDPLKDFAALMKLLAGACDETPAVLDVNSGRWHPRRSLDEQFGADAVPPEDVLWMTHVIVSAPGDATANAWLHTHGLRRCGRPELEMVDVPVRYADRAAELLGGLAGRLLEDGIPAPGAPFAVGPGLEVTLQPWQAVAPHLGDAPGGTADRIGMPGDAHVGVRAVVCGVERPGESPQTFWPQEVLRRIDRGEGSLFLSQHETRRLAARARTAWPRFAGAFATVSPQLLAVVSPPRDDVDDDAVRFLVKAGLVEETSGGGSASGEGAREHLWFVVRRCEEGRFEGELLNRPVLVRSLKRGDVTWVDRTRVSDWSVVTPLGSYGPGEVKEMSGALEALATETGGAT
jgi:hypothetical protein